MLRIGICDDVRADRAKIQDMVIHALFAYGELEFSFFQSGEEVIQSIQEDKFLCDLLMLDINMPELNGIHIAQYIRDNQVDVDIIFVTVSTDHVFDGYTYQAFSYLLKPVDVRRLEDELARYMAQRNNSSNCLHVTINNRKEQIFLDSVYYFEGDGRKIRCHKKGEEQEFYAKMKDLEQILSEYHFIRCHQSYLVNEKYVERGTRTELFVAGQALPISRKYLESVREFLEQRGGVQHGAESE